MTTATDTPPTTISTPTPSLVPAPARTPGQTIPARVAGMARTHRSLIWLGVMVALWGLTWPATKIALDSVPPLWLASVRFGMAGLCLFALVAARGELRPPRKGDWPIVFSVGCLQMMAFSALGMMALRHTDASHAVLLAYTTPLWVVVVASMTARRVPSRTQLAALLIGLLGIGLIVSPWEMDWTAPGAVMGGGLLLVGAVCWAVVILHVRRHQWVSSPLALAPWQMLLASVPLAAIAWNVEGAPWTIDLHPRAMEALLFIGPIATPLCFVISSEYGRRISAVAMSNLTQAIPVIGIVASVCLFDNRLSALFIAGLVLILAGVTLTATTANKAEPAT